MSNERIDLTQFEPIIGIDWFYEDGVLYLNERKFRYAIYEATDLADINEDLWEEHEQELEELDASFTNAIQDLPNLIAELKRCYEEIDRLRPIAQDWVKLDAHTDDGKCLILDMEDSDGNCFSGYINRASE